MQFLHRPLIRKPPATFRILRLALLSMLAFLVATPDARSMSLENRVREAALADYIHGMTAEIARKEIGTAGVPELLKLLHDPSYPRRDNVVAFLTYLGGAETVSALERFLAAPPSSPSIPEEDRALLLAPQALGMIAARGGRPALDALMAMTADGGGGGVLAEAAARGERPQALLQDLLEMALLGLAYSGDPAARRRIEDIRAGRVRPVPGGRSLDRGAEAALELFDRRSNPDAVKERAQDPSGAALDGSSTEQGASAAVADTSTTSHHHFLSYANHVDHNDPMTDARLDTVLTDGWKRVRLADFSTDVACCNTFGRKGTGLIFGTPGDGLDTIDSFGEQLAVVDNNIARIKVVRIINFCGAPGTNIIGCGEVSGNSYAVVRRTSLASEAVLWVHEYGHNVGIGHNTDSRYIMYATNYGTNNGVSQAECDKYHVPNSYAQADLIDAGPCVQGVCGNATCESGETCNSCGTDCASSPGAVCSNGLCEAGNGEDCVSCPADCRGVQSGTPANRYCCGDGGGQYPVPCSDPRCTANGYQCTGLPTVGHCCGNLLCEGPETNANCPADCAGSALDVWRVFGTAQGGTIDQTIAGVPIRIVTTAGQTQTQVAAAVAAQINGDPTLAGMGVTATVSGNEVTTNGTFDNSMVNDPGLTQGSPPPPGIPTLSRGGGLLLAGFLVVAAFLRRRNARA